jgi:hypothetical protein
LGFSGGTVRLVCRQYFCGEVAFRHEAPFDRSSLTRWRQRLGEEQIAALLQESLSVAHRTGAIESKDLERVVVDTTVQEKAIAHPTDARLTHRAIEKLVETAKRELRQSYLRVAKRAAIMVGRYTHAHQFKRARRVKSAVSSAHPPCPLLLPSQPNRCIAAAHDETGEVEEVDEKSKIARRQRQIQPWLSRSSQTKPSSQLAQIFRHIAELFQYDRVRKLANARIAWKGPGRTHW